METSLRMGNTGEGKAGQVYRVICVVLGLQDFQLEVKGGGWEEDQGCPVVQPGESPVWGRRTGEVLKRHRKEQL